jgi:hypothetical protein
MVRGEIMPFCAFATRCQALRKSPRLGNFFSIAARPSGAKAPFILGESPYGLKPVPFKSNANWLTAQRLRLLYLALIFIVR